MSQQVRKCVAVENPSKEAAAWQWKRDDELKDTEEIKPPTIAGRLVAPRAAVDVRREVLLTVYFTGNTGYDAC